MTETAVKPRDPCIPLVAAARVFRLSHRLDSAELQLNAAAKFFRDLGIRNTSRAYKAESRALMYARLQSNLRYELAKALAYKTDIAPADVGDYDYSIDEEIL